MPRRRAAVGGGGNAAAAAIPPPPPILKVVTGRKETTTIQDLDDVVAGTVFRATKSIYFTDVPDDDDIMDDSNGILFIKLTDGAVMALEGRRAFEVMDASGTWVHGYLPLAATLTVQEGS